MKNDFHFFLVGILFFLATFVVNPKVGSDENYKVLPPPDGVEYTHFGFRNAFADLLWLQFIQRSWDCSKYKDPNGQHCPHRWGYRTLKASSILDSRFMAIYLFGATKLTVLLDDHEGAADLYDMGLSYYPNDWKLNYNASYIYIEELKDNERAAFLLNRASENGAPEWTRSLASRLYKKSGKLELSFRLLKSLYEDVEAENWKAELEKRLQELAKEIAGLQRSEGS